MFTLHRPILTTFLSHLKCSSSGLFGYKLNRILYDFYDMTLYDLR